MQLPGSREHLAAARARCACAGRRRRPRGEAWRRPAVQQASQVQRCSSGSRSRTVRLRSAAAQCCAP